MLARPLASAILAAALVLVAPAARAWDPSCDDLPMCAGNSWGCSDGSNPDADPTCEAQNADDPDVGLMCVACCYVVDPQNPYSYSTAAVGCR